MAQVEFRLLRQPLDGSLDALRRLLPLHNGGRQHQLGERPALGQHVPDVLQRRPGGRCHHADAQRIRRQQPPPLRSEQPLFFQPLPQLLELCREQPGALVPHEVADELQFSARFVDRNPAVDEDPVAGREDHALVVAAEQHHAHARVVVPEREILVPGRRAAVVGHFAQQPRARKRFARLDPLADDAQQHRGRKGLLHHRRACTPFSLTTNRQLAPAALAGYAFHVLTESVFTRIFVPAR
ncbi:MAG: hypothetical protein U5Q44_14270 [Dehalococcoidia bacterium]|nr:hypothetical protein [Dehalococcoidia bacterium]